MRKDKDEDWLEGGEKPEAPAATTTTKGVVVTRSGLEEFSGYALKTLDKMFSDGAPIISKGNRRQGYRINTAAWLAWHVRQIRKDASGDPEGASYESAKRRDKEAQAKAREIANKKAEAQLLEIENVTAFIGSKIGAIRGRALSLPTQVAGLTVDQREELSAAIHDMLSDLCGDKMEDWQNGEATEDSSEGDGSE